MIIFVTVFTILFAAISFAPLMADNVDVAAAVKVPD